MLRCPLSTVLNLSLSFLAIAGACPAAAAPFDLATANDLFAPSFRGGPDSVYLGWDTFGGPLDAVIADSTPDLGSGVGSFVTTNGEDHLSGSLNYYSGFGSVAEDVTLVAPGVDGAGFTTLIVQARTLFGGWGEPIRFSAIDGVEPAQVLQATNRVGRGQLFARYELPGTAGPIAFSISSAPQSFTSFDRFVVDAWWSADGFAPDTAAVTPEPAAAVLVGVLAGLWSPRCARRRGVSMEGVR